VRRPSGTGKDNHAEVEPPSIAEAKPPRRSWRPSPPSVATPEPKPELLRVASAVRGGLDILVTPAPGLRSTFLAPRPAARAAFRLARRPGWVARRLGSFGVELAATAAGVSPRAPSPKDRRFAAPAWRHSWLFRRSAQAYPAALATAEELIGDAELDWAADEELRFAVEHIADAVAPTNFLWSNPTALKVTIDYGGANLVQGARNLLRDVSTPPRLPASVDTSKLGETWRRRRGRSCIEPRCSS
jgi:polyhydroxyalkanoate synthase